MIKITITSGEWTGRTRYFLGNRVIEDLKERRLGEQIKPADLFAGFMYHGDKWAVDYSSATDEEVILWFRAELVAIILQALRAGLPVKFLGREWRVREGDDPQQVAQDLEDAIVASGRMITIDSDDKKGVVVGVSGWEQ